MKTTTLIRKISFPALFALCLGMGGCNDFLERSAQNLVIPTTCADYTEILQGEGYFGDLIREGVWVNLMTDDMELFTPRYDNTLLLEEDFGPWDEADAPAAGTEKE